MSVHRRSIGEPVLHPIAVPPVVVETSPEAPALAIPFAPSTNPPGRESVGRQRASVVGESAVAVKARLAHYARVRDRVLAAGGEDRQTLVDYLKRFDPVVAPPAMHLPLVTVDHPTLTILPEDVAFVALREDPTHALGVIAAISSGGVPVGFFIQTLTKRPGDCSDYLDFAVVNPNHGSALGIGQELTNLVDRLATAIGSTRGGLKTAWIGRYYWARRGYDFATADDRAHVLDCLKRFIAHLGVRESDLRIGDAPFTWDALRHSWDVAALRSVHGSVEVPGLVAADQQKTVIADVGKAFFLGDWSDPTLGQKGANLFVRNYNGLRQRS